MIEYVEVRNSAFDVIGILDTFQSVIWHSVFFGVGDFQIYISVNDALSVIADAAYITRTDNDEVGVVESILIDDDLEFGKMVTIKGRFAKSILDRRIIYDLSGTSNRAVILRGNVEANVRNLVNAHAIANRSLGVLDLGESAGISKIIVDESGNAAEKQVSFENLLTYTDSLLQEYRLASRVTLRGNRLLYSVHQGTDRSAYIVFSREFDNLKSSAYSIDTTSEKNVYLVGGEGEGVERFCVLFGTKNGMDRKEVFVDASSISKKYKDQNETEQEYTDTQYSAMLKAHALQETSAMRVIEDFHGEIDVTSSQWKLGEDYLLGDIVTVQDNDIGAYKKVRITEVTEFQESDGYNVEAVYEGE